MLDLVIVIISVTGSLFLGLFMILNNRKSATNIYFTILDLCNGLYTLFNYLVLNSHSNNEAFFWTKLVMSVAIPVGPSFYFFVKAFPGKKFIFNGLIQLLIALWMATNILLVYAGLIFSSVDLKNSHLDLHPGPLIVSFALMQVATIATASWVLVQKYRKSVGKLKLQLRYVTYGILTSFALTLISTVLLPLVFGVTLFIAISPLFLLIAGVAVAYSIVRHSLLDFRLVVARSVAYTLLIALLGLFYSGLVFGISNYFFQNKADLKQALVYFVLALFITFTFNPLRKIIEKVTDRFLFKNSYDSSQLLANLTRITTSTIQLGDLTHHALQQLIEAMHISKGAFLIFNKQGMYSPMSEGYQSPPNYTLAQVTQLCNYKKALFFDDEDDETVKQLLRQINATVALPLFVGDKLHGLLLLGEKLSGEIYSEQDAQVLNIFGSEMAVSVQNAKDYEEIKSFNITLRSEVDKATNQLRVVNAKLKELDQLKDDFVSIASHELRTPMTAIRSYSWMALNRSDIPLSDKMKKYLGRTLLSTERLINLVNDMLNISRIESGKIALTPTIFNVGELVAEVLSEVEVKAREKNVHLQMAQMQLPQLFADPDKVHQVLLNLVGNALKFTPEDGNISIGFFPDGQMMDISVKDSGVGISKDDQSRLFTKFGRLDNSYVAAATSGGTGLGLYICKSLVELMKGRIWASSEGLGTGTTFTFSLPIANQQVLQNAAQYSRKPEGDVKGLEPVAI